MTIRFPVTEQPKPRAPPTRRRTLAFRRASTTVNNVRAGAHTLVRWEDGWMAPSTVWTWPG